MLDCTARIGGRSPNQIGVTEVDAEGLALSLQSRPQTQHVLEERASVSRGPLGLDPSIALSLPPRECCDSLLPSIEPLYESLGLFAFATRQRKRPLYLG